MAMFPLGSRLAKFQPLSMIAKVKIYNLNVTEVRDSDFKNAFPGIFNFTVGILGAPYIFQILKIWTRQAARIDNPTEKYHTVWSIP